MQPRYVSATVLQAIAQEPADAASRQSYAAIATEVAYYDPETQIIVMVASGRSGGTINVHAAPDQALAPPTVYEAHQRDAASQATD